MFTDRMPSFLSPASLQMRMADAPSQICDAKPAVIKPLVSPLDCSSFNDLSLPTVARLEFARKPCVPHRVVAGRGRILAWCRLNTRGSAGMEEDVGGSSHPRLYRG